MKGDVESWRRWNSCLSFTSRKPLVAATCLSVMERLFTWAPPPALDRCWAQFIMEHEDWSQDVNPSLAIALYTLCSTCLHYPHVSQWIGITSPTHPSLNCCHHIYPYTRHANRAVAAFCSWDFINFSLTSVHTKLGKKSLYFAPSTWNTLQQDLKPSGLIPLSNFKFISSRLVVVHYAHCQILIFLPSLQQRALALLFIQNPP